jgi:hypothetical protein
MQSTITDHQCTRCALVGLYGVEHIRQQRICKQKPSTGSQSYAHSYECPFKTKAFASLASFFAALNIKVGGETRKI